MWLSVRQAWRANEAQQGGLHHPLARRRHACPSHLTEDDELTFVSTGVVEPTIEDRLRFGFLIMEGERV